MVKQIDSDYLTPSTITDSNHEPIGDHCVKIIGRSEKRIEIAVKLYRSDFRYGNMSFHKNLIKKFGYPPHASSLRGEGGGGGNNSNDVVLRR